MLIGNLTRDIELRYTPSGTAIATFGMATNRGWTTDAGEKQEDTQFHRIVAWSKLAEICDQLLFKGRKVFIEGRMQTRKFTGQDGQQREITEVVAENMMILDNRRRDGSDVPEENDFVGIDSPATDAGQAPAQATAGDDTPVSPAPSDDKKKPAKKEEITDESSDEVNVEDIPF
jgi:single-strand DNA-binding protein